MTVKPFVGQFVDYTPAKNEAGANRTAVFNKGDQPLAAVVTYVHPDGRVNLSIWDHNGGQYSRPMIEFIQAGHAVPDKGIFAQPQRKAMHDDAEKKMMEDGIPQTAARQKIATGQLGDDRTATEGQPQRGDPADPDPRTPPTVEHVAADPAARVNLGLPAEETDTEKKQHEDADKPAEGVEVDGETVDQISDEEFEQAMSEEVGGDPEPTTRSGKAKKASKVSPDLAKK